jgi:hypothetical protein
MFSSRDSGSRIEIVRLDGFKLENSVSFAFDQSMYSVESWVAQKSRSSSSFRNFGIFLNFFMIGLPLLPVHIASRDHPDSRSPGRKYDEHQPRVICLTERTMPGLLFGVFEIRVDEQWEIEEYLLAFPPRDSVFRPTLIPVPLIPLKALDMVRYLHSQCIQRIYTIYRGLSSRPVLPNG